MIDNERALEIFVYELYNDLGYSNVKFDNKLNRKIENNYITGKMDIIYNKFFIKRYVECIYRNNSNVTFDDYEQFETTLKKFNIFPMFGEMVTNAHFDSEVTARASKIGIKLIDIDGLEKLNSKRTDFSRIGLLAYNFMEHVDKTSFMDAFKKYSVKLLTVEKQLQHYSKLD